MLNQSVKVVLFDFGGVLAEEGFHNGLVVMAQEQGLGIADMPNAAIRAVYDSGFVKSDPRLPFGGINNSRYER